MNNNFKIMLSSQVTEGTAKEDLAKIVKQLEKQKITLKLDTKILEKNCKNVEKIFKNAFNLDKTQIANLTKLKSVLSEINKLGAETKKQLLGIKVPNTKDSKVSQTSKDLLSMKSNVEKHIASLERLNKSTKGINNVEVEKMIQKYKELRNVLNGDLNKSQLAELKSEITHLSNSSEQLKRVTLEMKALSDSKISLNNTIAKLERLERQIIELGDDASLITALKNELIGLSSSTNLNAINNGVLRGREELARYRAEMESNKNVMTTFRKSFSDLYSTVRGYALGNIVATATIGGFASLKDTIMSLDEAFVQFKKVAPDSVDTSTEALKELQAQAVLAGQEVASTSVDIINSTASALQMGMKDANEAMEYAKNVTMYANVADIETDEADTYLKTAMSVWGGINNALKPVHEQIKGMSKDYNIMTKYLDLANYAGKRFACPITNGWILNCLEAFRAY